MMQEEDGAIYKVSTAALLEEREHEAWVIQDPLNALAKFFFNVKANQPEFLETRIDSWNPFHKLHYPVNEIGITYITPEFYKKDVFNACSTAELQTNKNIQTFLAPDRACKHELSELAKRCKFLALEDFMKRDFGEGKLQTT